MKNLKINHKEISYENIINKKFSNSDFSEYEMKTLIFCQNWLKEKENFTVNTSGSTGKPKPININRNKMITSAKLTGEFLNLKSNDKEFICLSSEYIAGMMMIVRGFVLDLDINIFDVSSNPLKNIKDKFDFSAFVPMQLYEIIKNTPEKIELLNLMKNIIIGGGAINYNLEKELINLKGNVYNTYGMTETITHIALRKINGDNRKEYFTCLKGVNISQDTRGCLVINSDITNNQEIVTNDLVEILSEKDFKVIGRIDNIINSGGIKIQAETIEIAIDKVLFNLKLNLRFFVSSLIDEKYGHIVITAFESKKIDLDLENKVLSNLKKILKKYEIPKKILYTEKFQETETGKIDKIKTMKTFSNGQKMILKDHSEEK